MTKSCVNDFESKLSSFDLQIFVSIESNQKDFLLISRLQIPFSTYKCCLWTHEKTPACNFYVIFPSTSQPESYHLWNAGNFPEALLRAVRLEAQYCYIPQVFHEGFTLKMDRVFPKPEGENLLFLLGENFQVNSAVQLWEGTIFFRHFLKELKVRKA